MIQQQAFGALPFVAFDTAWNELVEAAGTTVDTLAAGMAYGISLATVIYPPIYLVFSMLAWMAYGRGELVLAWKRGRIPLIYLGVVLVAVVVMLPVYLLSG